jgi:ParB family chromosome partitioning protein
MPSVDNFFTTEQDRQEEQHERIVPLEIAELHDFPKHPFQVRDDEEMEKMVESVKEYGVLSPLLVRSRENGGYEIVSGHRRCHAARLAGLTEIKAIVQDMDDDTAVIFMVDANCQRENIRPTEKAKAYQMKMEALKRQGERNDLTSAQLGQKLKVPYSVEQVAADAGESRMQVQRYIRLNDLIPELQEMVDDKKLKFNPAVEVSYLPPEQQQTFLEYIEAEERTPSLSQAQQLKTASKENALTEERLVTIMASRTPTVKPQEMRITISYSQLEKYFPKNVTTEQMVSQIIKLLEAHYRTRQRGMER